MAGTDPRDDFERRFVAAFERNTQALDRNTRAWGHTVVALRSVADHLDSQRGEIRTQTEATWRMIDRFDAGGQEA